LVPDVPDSTEGFELQEILITPSGTLREAHFSLAHSFQLIHRLGPTYC
jgi:hypothetical protein